MPKLTKAWNAIGSTVDAVKKYAGESQAFQTARQFSAGAIKRTRDSGAYKSAAGTLRADSMAGRRAVGGAMNRMAGGGSFGSAMGGMGRDAMRDIGGKRLAGYGAAGVGAGAATADFLNPWGLGWGD